MRSLSVGRGIKPRPELGMRLASRVSPLLETGRWRTGKYYTNSGTYNAVNPHSTVSRSPTPSNTNKSYHVNTESKLGWYPQQFNGSMINYRKVSYDPITNAVMHSSGASSPHKLKGLGEIYDRACVYNRPINKNYEAALSIDSKAFHKRVGEFSNYADSLRKRNTSPFERRI